MLNDLASVSMTPYDYVQMKWKGLEQKTTVGCCTYQLGNTTERYKRDKITEHRNFHNASHNLYCLEDIMRNKGLRKIRSARIGETAMTHHCSRKTLQRETELETTGADDGLSKYILRVQPTRWDVSDQYCYLQLAAGSSIGPTSAWRCMCSFELLMMDGKPVWNM